jgi:hypothetical protein
MSTISDNLWPEDIKSQEFLKPQEILETQAKHLTKQTRGLVEGEVVREEFAAKEGEEARIVLKFEIFSSRAQKRMKLFEVSHQSETIYPVALEPPTDTLPEYLQERVYVEGRPGIADAAIRQIGHSHLAQFIGTPGRWVDREWIAGTPLKFVEKVKLILQMQTVKSAVMSLLAKSQTTDDSKVTEETTDLEGHEQ